MVIYEVLLENAACVRLVQDDHVIQALAFEGADNALAVTVLPGRASADHLFLGVHAPERSLQTSGADQVVQECEDDVAHG